MFQLQMPAEGAARGIVNSGIAVGVPAILAGLVISQIVRIRGKGRSAVLILLGLSLIVFAGEAGVFWQRLQVGDYIRNQSQDSRLIETYYVDPDDTRITFPEKKRNLIYIYLESIEVLYENMPIDGERYDLIPDLKELAVENEDFSGTDRETNGGLVLYGGGWTMGAMFSESAGLPLLVGADIDGNAMNTQQAFFPGIVTIGDILDRNGYHNMLMIGSDATFGGRRLFYESHGPYDIYDYEYAIEKGWIPEDYMVWWGFEDSKLYQLAKNTLDTVGAEEEPFNLTLLTVDTHSEDGYVCDLCQEEFPDNQYANVIACAGRQAADFVAWCRTQDWYDQTTIVISGDHWTMDADFFDEATEEDERKTYTCIINSAVSREQDTFREYSTLDLFPTTIAALGGEIEGNRLGLGTNLYSDEATLAEQFGSDYLNREFRKHSAFMEQMVNMEENDEYIHQTGHAASADLSVIDWGEYYEFLIYRINYSGRIAEYLLTVEDAEDPGQAALTLSPQYDFEFGLYKAYVDKKDLASDRISIICLVRDRNGKTYRGDPVYYDLLLARQHDDFDAYLERCIEKLPEYTLFLSIYDEGTEGLTDHQRRLLADLGLQADFTDGFRKSYYAIVDRGRVEEKLSNDYLTSEGTLDDGCTYLITSAGFNVPERYNGTYIALNDAFFSKGLRGFNVAVYSNRFHCVVDSAVFDTFLGKHSVTVGREYLGTGEYVIPNLTDIGSGCRNTWLVLKPEYQKTGIILQREGNTCYRWRALPAERYLSYQEGILYQQRVDGTIEAMKVGLN